nr:unnamed protein product [Spirometra erinaceieuropaei]
MDMRRSINLFAATRDNFGLAINTKKTAVMHQPPSEAAYVAPQLNVNGAQVQVVDNSTYPASTLSCSTKIDDKVAGWISKASQAFGRLPNSLESSWSSVQHESEDV